MRALIADPEPERRLPHRRARGDDDQIARLEAAGDLVEVVGRPDPVREADPMRLAAVHHLAVLERTGNAVRYHTARRVYWTLPGGKCVPRPVGTAARVLREVEGNPGIGPSQVAKALGVRHSTVAYHAKRLASLGRLRIAAEGRSPILELETQGAKEVQATAPDAVTIFVQAPSFGELEELGF